MYYKKRMIHKVIKTVLLVTACIGMTLLLGACETKELTAMKVDNAQLRLHNESLLAQIKDMQEQLDNIDGTTAQEDTGEEELLDDLEKRISLIPVEAQLGGTFYYAREDCKILSDHNAYAYAEDGHLAVEMLLRYTVNEDDTIDWSLIAYDAGGGWQMAQAVEPADLSSEDAASGETSSEASTSGASSSSVSSSSAASEAAENRSGTDTAGADGTGTDTAGAGTSSSQAVPPPVDTASDASSAASSSAANSSQADSSQADTSETAASSSQPSIRVPEVSPSEIESFKNIADKLK